MSRRRRRRRHSAVGFLPWRLLSLRLPQRGSCGVRAGALASSSRGACGCPAETVPRTTQDRTQRRHRHLQPVLCSQLEARWAACPCSPTPRGTGRGGTARNIRVSNAPLLCLTDGGAPASWSGRSRAVGRGADEDGFKTVDIYKTVTRLTNQSQPKTGHTRTRKHTRRHTPAQDNQPTQPASHTSTTPPLTHSHAQRPSS